jgi:hypothetical protein
MQVAIRNSHSAVANATSALADGRAMTFAKTKKASLTASFAMFVAAASADERAAFAAQQYATWLDTSNYKPVMGDMLASGLLAKSACEALSYMVPADGNVNRETLVAFTTAVVGMADKALAKGGKDFKGLKALAYNVASAIIDAHKRDTAEKEALSLIHISEPTRPEE